MKKYLPILILVLVVLVVSGCTDNSEVKKTIEEAPGQIGDEITGAVDDVVSGTADDVKRSAEDKAQNTVDDLLDSVPGINP